MELAYNYSVKQSYLSFIILEHFKPGKLNANDRWKPNENRTSRENSEENPTKRKFKTLDDIYQASSSTTKHTTYHVPPGL